MSQQSNRQYACRNCGAAYTANPPDDQHNQCSITNDVPDSLPQNYDCSECDHRNVLFWFYSDPNPS